jgi:hypothetical protein
MELLGDLYNYRFCLENYAWEVNMFPNLDHEIESSTLVIYHNS